MLSRNRPTYAKASVDTLRQAKVACHPKLRSSEGWWSLAGSNR